MLCCEKKEIKIGEVIQTIVLFTYQHLVRKSQYDAGCAGNKAMGGKRLMGRKLQGCDWNNDERSWTTNISATQTAVTLDHLYDFFRAA